MDEDLKTIQDELGELQGNIKEFRKQADELEKAGKSAATERAKIAELGQKHGALIEELQAKLIEIDNLSKRLDEFAVKAERIGANQGVETLKAEVDKAHEQMFVNRVSVMKGQLREEEIREYYNNLPVEVRDMLAGVDATGGMMIPENMAQRIIEKFIDINPVRANATVVTISQGNQWTEFREKDHPTPENVGETGTASEDEVEFVEHDIKVHHIRSVVPISDTLLADVPAMQGLVERIVGRKFLQLESQNFVTGNDVLKARGFAHNIQASSNDSDVWSVTGAGTQLVAANDFMTLIKDVDNVYWPNGKFFMNQTTWGNVLNLVDSNGAYMLRNLEAAPALTIRGFPVVIMNTIANEGDDVYPVFFGDMMQAYVVVDRSGIVLLRDPYTDYPVDKFKFSKRVGGRVVCPAALRALKTT